MATMSFIRRIQRKGRVYLAEVENKWVKGKVVQRHIRYVGREADGKTLLAASLSEVEVEQVKLYGSLTGTPSSGKENWSARATRSLQPGNPQLGLCPLPRLPQPQPHAPVV